MFGKKRYDYYRGPTKPGPSRKLILLIFGLLFVIAILFVIALCTTNACAWDNNQDHHDKNNDNNSCNSFVSPIPTSMIVIPTPPVTVQPTDTPVPSTGPTPTAGQSATPTPGPGPTPTPGTQINTAASANNASVPQAAPDTGRAE